MVFPHVRNLSLILCLGLLSACAAMPNTPSHTTTAEPAAAADSMRFEPDIRAFEEADSHVRRRPGSVVFVGSSSIRLWETLGEDFPGVATINRGFGGSRMRDATYYADRIVVNYQPRGVVVYAGDNDLEEGRTPEQVRDDFAAFVEKVHAGAPNARIAFISIKPSPSRHALMPQARKANALVQAYAKTQHGVDFLDVYTPMLAGNGEPRAELFVADALHLNRSGYGIWAGVVRPWLAGL